MEVEMEDGVAAGPDEEFVAQGPRALCGAPATVAVFQQYTEGAVLAQQQWKAIRERRARGQSVSEIARELDVDRKTVRNSLH